MVCADVAPDAVRSANGKCTDLKGDDVKQKREKELGYPMWVLGPGFMAMRWGKRSRSACTVCLPVGGWRSSPR